MTCPNEATIQAIPGHPGYGATRDGGIWSYRSGTWRRLKPSKDLQGRLKVNLARQKTYKVASLIALTYLGPRPDRHDVDIRDGDLSNCAVTNLAYRTRSQNMQAAIREGRMAPPPDWVYQRMQRTSRPLRPKLRLPIHEKRAISAAKLGIRQIKYHPNYGVTEDGAVWSFKKSRGAWRQLKPVPDSRGLPKVKLGRKLTRSVHTLVAEEFLGPRPKGMTIVHVDGKRFNTAASNLKYVSKSDDNKAVWVAGAQSSGWRTRRQKLHAMGCERWAANGAYPISPPAATEMSGL